MIITGQGFGDKWLTTHPTCVGEIIAGKRIHNDTTVELIMPPLRQGTHEIKLYINDYGIVALR